MELIIPANLWWFLMQRINWESGDEMSLQRDLGQNSEDGHR